MRLLLCLGAATRILLLLIAAWQDAYLDVKFTDIDYHVYTDAAKHVLQGGSPYDRPTYRYTPIIAWLLLPNHLLFAAWGKVLFCAADIAVAYLGAKYYKVRGTQNERNEATAPPAQHFVPNASAWQVLLAISLWLFNPYTVTISARGSCESPVVALTVAMLWLLAEAKRRGAGRKAFRRVVVASLLYGLVCHWRVYPIIYAPAIVLYLADHPGGSEKRLHTVAATTRDRLMHVWAVATRALVTPWVWVFAGGATVTFFALLGVCFALYGAPFIHEAFLYHLSRRDPRHSFSMFWYPTYLSMHHPHSLTRYALALATPLQLGLVAATAAARHHQLPCCLMLQTLVFVTFNKVCTAQYFVWYLSLLPLALPSLQLTQHRGPLLAASGCWLAAQLHWLAWAYALEFRGKEVYLQLWAASVTFFGANVALLCVLLRASGNTTNKSTKALT